MDRKSLEKMLLKDMRANIYASVLSFAVLTSAVMGLLIMNIPYVNIVKYIEILPIGSAVMIIALIVLSSYAIYFFAMKKVTGRKIIELIKSED